MTPLISVIIPVYNVEAYLPACLDSVLSQSLKEIEIICIDDASPDGCGRILDKYAAEDCRVKVIHLAENHMQGYGRNRGLEMAEGEYVYFLDSDDMIGPDALQGMYQCMRKDDLDGLFFDSEVLYENEALKIRHSSYPRGRKGTYDGEVKRGEKLLDEFSANGDWLVYVQRECWRRQYLIDHKVRFPERVEHEDEYFSYLAILLADRTRYVSNRWFIRRYRPDSAMTRSLSARDFHGYFTNFLRMIDAAEKYGFTGEGAKAQILHMYEHADSLFPTFIGEDPDAWFQDPVDRIRFGFFRDERSCRQVLMQRENSVWRPLKQYRDLYLYGTGRVASLALEKMHYAGLEPVGALLTSLKGQPSVWRGIRTLQADQAVIDRQDAVVIAMSDAFRQELMPFLRQQGWNCWWYAKDRLESIDFEGEDHD